MKNILLLKGASKYNVVRCFVDFLGEGLRKNHCNVEVWDLCHMDDTEVEARIKEWETDVPDAILSFNAIGKESFQQYQDIPFIGWLVDHPIFHHLRLFLHTQDILSFHHLISALQSYTRQDTRTSLLPFGQAPSDI